MMVSRVPTFSIKKIRIAPEQVLPTLLVASVVIVGLVVETWLTLSLIGLLYLLSLPVSVVVARRMREREAAAAPPVPPEEAAAERVVSLGPAPAATLLTGQATASLAPSHARCATAAADRPAARSRRRRPGAPRHAAPIPLPGVASPSACWRSSRSPPKPTALALALLLVNRLADGLDGAVARQTRLTDLGGFLDIVLDFIVYAGMVFAFALADPAANALAAAFLLFAFMGTGSSFLAFAIMAAKRGHLDRSAWPQVALLSGRAGRRHRDHPVPGAGLPPARSVRARWLSASRPCAGSPRSGV